MAIFVCFRSLGIRKHLNPATWTPELSTDAVIVQPLCNLSFPLETTAVGSDQHALFI